MSYLRELEERTKDLFRVDAGQPEKVHAVLYAFHELTNRTPLNPGLDDFIGVLRTILKAFPLVDAPLPEQQALFMVLDGLQAQIHRTPRPTHHYHNDAHTMQVTAARIVLGGLQHQEHGGPWTSENFCKFLRGIIIAINHDNGHLGRKNKFPMEQEMIAFQLLLPILEEAGVSQKEQIFIGQATMLTDPDLPGDILKYGVAIHDISTDALHLPPELLWGKIAKETEPTQGILTDLISDVMVDNNLTEEGALIKSSDMLGAYGLDRNLCIKSNHNFQLEMQARANPVIRNHSVHA